MNYRPLARLGYLARALVYFLMGCFAILLMFGNSHGKTTDSKGALRQLMEEPFGHFLLFIIACGLFCYSIWRFAQSFKDLSHLGTDAKAMLTRVGYAFGGITHGLLGIYAIKLIFDMSSKSTTSERSIAHWLLAQPFGQFLTGAVALAIIGFGMTQFIMGWKEKFLKQVDLPSDVSNWLCPICKFGFMARGFVFVLIGSFFLQAALHYNSQEAGGIAKAWMVMRNQPYGNFLIFLMALGFIAFAFYGFAESKYQKQIVG